MKNQLIPLSASATSNTWEPSLVPLGYRPESLDQALSYRDGHPKIRRDLDGLVHHQNGNPIIELPYPESICIVQNPSEEILKEWKKTQEA